MIYMRIYECMYVCMYVEHCVHTGHSVLPVDFASLRQAQIHVLRHLIHQGCPFVF